jgi:hypothetical protein
LVFHFSKRENPPMRAVKKNITVLKKALLRLEKESKAQATLEAARRRGAWNAERALHLARAKASK